MFLESTWLNERRPNDLGIHQLQKTASSCNLKAFIFDVCSQELLLTTQCIDNDETKSKWQSRA